MILRPTSLLILIGCLISCAGPVHSTSKSRDGTDRYVLLMSKGAAANYDIQQRQWLFNDLLIADGSALSGVYSAIMKRQTSVFNRSGDLFSRDKPRFLLLDKGLQPIAEQRFTDLHLSDTGLHIAGTESERNHGLIDNTGEWVYPPAGEIIYYLDDDSLCFLKDGTIRVTNRSLKTKFTIEDKRFYSISAYDGGARVLLRTYNDSGFWLGTIKDGRLANPEQLKTFRRVHRASKSLLLAEYSDDKGNRQYCYLNWDGQIAIKGPFRQAGLFRDGLAPVTLEQSAYSLDLYDGLPDYDGLYALDAEGLQPIELPPPPVWGFIDERGKLIIMPSYQAAGEFRKGLAPVVINGKWGFINTRNQMVIEPVFDKVKVGFDHSDYAVILQQAGGYYPNETMMQGVINRKGDWLLAPVLPLENR